MNLENVRKFLRPDPFRIWFGVSKEVEPDFFSRMIQKMLKSNYSHSLVIYYSLDIDDYVVANARGEAAQLDTLQQFYDIGDEVYHLFEKPLSHAEREKVFKTIIELDGVDYSERQIGQITVLFIKRILEKYKVLKPLVGLMNMMFLNKVNGTIGMICSEYADRIVSHAGVLSTSKIKKLSVDHITPRDNLEVWQESIGLNELKQLF